MKIFKLTILCLFSIIAFSACGDEETTITTHPEPVWSVDLSNQYPLSMSAIVTIPANLEAYHSDDDQLAPFIGDECRGVGQLQKYDNTKAYFILIKGTGSEQQKVSFKYYNKKNAYMYTTDAFLSFETDTRYGDVDQPKELLLQIVM